MKAPDKPIEEWTEEELKAVAPRDEKGRLLPGSSLGSLSKGVTRNSRLIERERKEMEKQLNARAKEQAEVMLNERLGDVLETLYQQAMTGCTKSLGLWMRHSTPVAQKSKTVDTDVLAEVANLPAEERLRFINRAMLSGEIDVDIGNELLKAQKAEIDATTMTRVQRLARRVQRGDVTLPDLAEEFGKIADDLPALIEGTVDEG